MHAKKSPSPLSQVVKGIFFFQEDTDSRTLALKLMTSLGCEVLNTSLDRLMIKTSLGNLQSIKKSWQANDKKSTMSRELNTCIKQILIGGRV